MLALAVYILNQVAKEQEIGILNKIYLYLIHLSFTNNKNNHGNHVSESRYY